MPVVPAIVSMGLALVIARGRSTPRAFAVAVAGTACGVVGYMVTSQLLLDDAQKQETSTASYRALVIVLMAGVFAIIARARRADGSWPSRGRA